MMKLLTVIGARPQIIKAAAISRAVKAHFEGLIEEKILHTGQHYDANMSQVFFDELGIPQPDYNLGVGSGSHGVQTAKMIAGIEEVLTSEHFDGIILYGNYSYSAFEFSQNEKKYQNYPSCSIALVCFFYIFINNCQ